MLEEEFSEFIKSMIADIFQSSAYKNESERGGLKNGIRKKVARLILNKLKQRPMILPLLIEQIKEEKSQESDSEEI